MKAARSQGGYQNEFLSLTLLLFIAMVILSSILWKWKTVIFCIFGFLIFLLLVLSFVYDPKRIVKNSREEEE